MVRIEDAGVAQFNDLFDAAIGRAVQIAFVLAEFDEKAVVNVALHLLPIQEMVIDSIGLARFRQPRRV